MKGKKAWRAGWAGKVKIAKEGSLSNGRLAAPERRIPAPRGG